MEIAPLSISFMLVVALLYSALIIGALWANNRVEPETRYPVRILRFFAGGFLLLVGMMAIDRRFTHFEKSPPPLLIAMLPAFLGMLFLAFHPLTLRWIREIPQRWLIGLQAFRIVIEIQLYGLFLNGLLPRAMTFAGWNFDVVIGLSAPVVAWFVHRAHVHKRGLPGLVAAWNILGLLMLTNVVARGILSMPTHFQVFEDPPGTISLAFFPWIWLPTFVVPFAYLLHVLSLRREYAFLDRRYKNGAAASGT